MLSRNLTKHKASNQRGVIEKAIQSWENVLNMVNIKNNAGIYFSALEHLGCAYQEIGHHQKAMKLFKQADPLLTTISCYYRKVLYHSSLADLYLSLGDKEKSMIFLKKAIADAKKLKDKTLISIVMNNIGNVMMARNKFNSALKVYSKALSLIKHSKQDDELKSAIMINIFIARLLTGKNYNINKLLRKALVQTKRLPDSHMKLNYMTSLNASTIYFSDLLSKNFDDIEQIAQKELTQTLEIANKLSDIRLLTKNYDYIGHLYEQKGKLKQAISYTQKAIFYASQGKTPESLYLWLWQSGRLYNLSGEKEKAIKLYQQSINKLTSIKKELFSGYRLNKDIFNEKIKPVYLELSGLFIDMADRANNEILKKKHLKSALEVMENFKSAELQDYFHDECVTKNKKKSNLLSKIPDNTALLYPISLPERLIVLVCISDRINYYTRHISEYDFNETVINYRKQLQTRYSNQFLKTSQKLYSYLVAPIEKDLDNNQVSTLLVCCNGKLRIIPFSTLHDGQQFLIEKYAIATILAVSLTESFPSQLNQKVILLSGLSDAVQDFSSLPSVKNEIETIKGMIKKNNVLLNKDYTKENLSNNIKNNSYSMVHLATHGVFAGTADDSYLLTYDDKLNMNDLEQLLSIGKYTNKQIDLLTFR